MMETVERIIRCPRCRKVTVWHDNPSRPFCSEKCRQIDLGHWANEDYAIAGKPAPQDDESSED